MSRGWPVTRVPAIEALDPAGEGWTLADFIEILSDPKTERVVVGWSDRLGSREHSAVPHAS